MQQWALLLKCITYVLCCPKEIPTSTISHFSCNTPLWSNIDRYCYLTGSPRVFNAACHAWFIDGLLNTFYFIPTAGIDRSLQLSSPCLPGWLYGPFHHSTNHAYYTRLFSAATLRNFSDDGSQYTSTIFQKLEFPETRSWAAPLRAGSTVCMGRLKEPTITVQITPAGLPSSS